MSYGDLRTKILEDSVKDIALEEDRRFIAYIEEALEAQELCENCGFPRNTHLDMGLYFKCLFETTEFKLRPKK